MLANDVQGKPEREAFEDAIRILTASLKQSVAPSRIYLMPGYSGTPLPKKLGIKPGFHVQLLNVPAEVGAELSDALAKCSIDHRKSLLDFVMLFTRSRLELTREFSRMTKQLAPAGMFWVSWPKKSSGVATDVDENVVREIGLAVGLVDVKVCAVTDVWSGLKFVRRLQDRKK
ncbi:MAG: DUF3052 family protein [Candidatus Sulfotelmatobacter sp.]